MTARTTHAAWATSVLLAGLLFSSCSKNQQDTPPTPTSTDSERAFPGRKGEVVTAYLNGSAMAVERIDGLRVFEGDIMFDSPGETPQTEGAGIISKYWPGAVVYYTINSAISATKRTTILNAIAYWESNTIVRFTPRTTEANYVEFMNSTGCSATIGMVGGRQTVNLADNCTYGNTIHEIGHTMGLLHEQTRADRDAYVVINYANIESGKEHNFNKYSSGFDNGAFDFGSIMLYGSYTFSANNLATITKLDGSTFTGQRTGLSAGDKATITAMYGTVGNAAPTASITAPVNNASYAAPASIIINATAADTDGTVSKVEFYNGATKLGEDATSPYSFTWTGVAAGSYALKVVAYDNLSVTGTSSSVNVTVTGGTDTTACSGIPAWSATQVYATPGIQVSYQGKVFSNKWWIQGTAPNQADTWGPWAFVKNCGE
ncbi:carbohydrate binding protein [Chitinophaga skermanii]|uniref:Carbohydrate binding protein n=1 Tax=Chitinophaga skermanii TaxID=331697 RepID=A0A327QW13_9BACT|nr:M12 family metallopeptidase [Chitinophaga skermanii]RAJ08789.1 carbohydrate binding protein [Chitinophaga skermanii]